MNNPPAFPQPIDDMGTFRAVTEGMTLRDYFAAKSMQGIMGNSTVAEAMMEVKKGCTAEQIAHLDAVVFPKCTAAASFAVADAMLAEREKPLPNETSQENHQ